MEFIWQPTYAGPNGPEASNETMWTHITNENYQGGCDIDLWTYFPNRQYVENFFNSKIV